MGIFAMRAMFLVVHVALLMTLRLFQLAMFICCLMRIEEGSTNNKEKRVLE
jgi:hypothetical protein